MDNNRTTIGEADRNFSHYRLGPIGPAGSVDGSASSPHILVVDDDPAILGMLRRGLAHEGFQVETAEDGGSALARSRDNEPDLVVLDILLPGMDGYEVASRLRQGSKTPIIMLSAKGSLTDKVKGFEVGADDYLTKPFDFDELVMRIRALLRRSQPVHGEILKFHDIVMDIGSHSVTRAGVTVAFSVREFDLLEFLMRNPRKVLTRKAIYERVWGYDFGHESNVIEVYVRYLRAKLEENGQKPVIYTIRGIGYVLRD